ncbi:MAG: ankyrin repeat domain-containing protein [Burkholderiales bacterium]|nr:ankyrin repeat domain-containing protein [Burkholderiales bacterium]
MTRWLRGFLGKLSILLVFTGAGLACAGSYDDFFNAVKQDNQGKVKELLLRGFDANTTGPKNQTGLYLALKEPSPKVAQVLIEWQKTDVNKLNAQGESALMLAALKGQLELAEKLIKKGADINKTGWTPLHYAASAGQTRLISLLLENNAYIDAESPNGTTPLMMAAMYGSAASVSLLLQEGADAKLKNQQGLTALEFAQRGNRPDAAAAIAAVIRSERPPGQW